jgi:hypothetical protein
MMALAGCAFLILGITGWWLATRVLDDDGFADVVATSSQQPAVRDYIGEQASLRLARTSGFVSAARPVVSQAISAAIDTPPVTNAIHQFASAAHAQLFRINDARRVDIDASQATVTIRAALESADPVLAAKLPANILNPATSVSQSNTIDVVAHASVWVRTLYIPVGLVGLALLLLASFWAEDRTHAVRFIGFTFMVAGVFPIGVELATPLLPSIDGATTDPGLGAAIAAFVRVLLSRLVDSGWALLIVGLLLALAAGADGGDLAARRQRARAWLRSNGTKVRWRLLGAAGLIVIATFMITRPTALLRTGLFVAGIGVLYTGLVFGLHACGLLVPGTPTVRVRKRQLGAIAAAMVAVLVATNAAAVVAIVVTKPAGRANPSASGCNGFIGLCDERLNQIVWPASHNAMNSSAYNFYEAEQTLTVGEQLNAGVKVLLLDAYYGYQDHGIVRTNLAGGVSRSTLNSDIGAAGIDELNRLGALTGTVDTSGKKQDVYFCHDYCELGAVKAVDVLKEVKAYLDRNPTDVLMIDFEDYVQPADLQKVLQQADLFDSVYTLPKSGPLPTLLDMVSAKPGEKQNPRRLIVTSERHPDVVPWLGGTYDLMQETPYTFNSISAFNCEPNRGLTSNPMLLVNHWLRSSGPPDPVEATKVNSEAELTTRMQQCIADRGRLPNILAVDFVAIGDLISTVNTFNGAIAQVTGVAQFWNDALSGDLVDKNLSAAERQQAASSLRLPATTDAAARQVLGIVADRLTVPDLVNDLKTVTTTSNGPATTKPVNETVTGSSSPSSAPS